jgi:hypothetical protein
MLLIETSSIRTPVEDRLLSEPMRHFNCTFCPPAAAGRFAVVVM